MFDTLAQIHLMRGSYERAGEYLRQAQRGLRRARHADHAVVRVVAEGARRKARHPTRRTTTRRLPWPKISSAPPNMPPSEPIQAELAACEALVCGPVGFDEAEHASRCVRGTSRPALRARERGANSCASAARCASRRQSSGRGPPRLRAERQRLRSAGRAVSRRAEPACPRPARGQGRHRAPRSGISIRRAPCSRRSAPQRDLTS